MVVPDRSRRSPGEFGQGSNGQHPTRIDTCRYVKVKLHNGLSAMTPRGHRVPSTYPPYRKPRLSLVLGDPDLPDPAVGIGTDGQRREDDGEPGDPAHGDDYVVRQGAGGDGCSAKPRIASAITDTG